MANLIKGNIVGRIFGVVEFGQSTMVGIRQGFRKEITKINLEQELYLYLSVSAQDSRSGKSTSNCPR